MRLSPFSLTLNGPGAIVFILCKTLPPPFPRGLKGANAAFGSVCPLALSGVNGRLISDGVVGVALRGLDIGKGGKAQSWGSEISGEWDLAGSGDVALLENPREIDLRPFAWDIGEALREWLVLLLGENWFGGSNGLLLSAPISLGTWFSRHLLDVLPTNASILGGGGILRDLSSDELFEELGAGGAKVPCTACKRGSGRGGAAVPQYHSTNK